MLFRSRELTQVAANRLRQQFLTILLASLLVGGSSASVAYVILHSSAVTEADKMLDRDLRIAWSEIHRIGYNFESHDGSLLLEGQRLFGRLDLVDRIAFLIEGSVVIYQGTEAIATSFMDRNNKRATAREMTDPALIKALYTDKQSYRGEQVILGETYIVGYDPILDSNGGAVGAVLVGIKAEEFFAPVYRVKKWIIIVSLLGTFLGMIFSLLYARILYLRSCIDPHTHAIYRHEGEQLLQEKYQQCVSKQRLIAIAIITLKEGYDHGFDLAKKRGLARQLVAYIDNRNSVILWGRDKLLIIYPDATQEFAVINTRQLLEELEVLEATEFGVVGIDPEAGSNSELSLSEFLSAAEYQLYQLRRSSKQTARDG